MRLLLAFGFMAGPAFMTSRVARKAFNLGGIFGEGEEKVDTGRGP